MTKKKPVVGVYGLTGCYGCLLSVIFNEDEILDLVKLVKINSFPFIKEKDKKNEKFDLVLLEGTVVTHENVDELKELRKNTKFLVALGACSCTGGIPAIKNFIRDYKFENLVYHKRDKIADVPPQPVDAFVHIDYYLPGCPPIKKEIMNFIKDFVNNKIPIPYDRAVCVECRMNKNKCLLIEEGKMCFGPMTRGGCNAVCLNAGLECWGCRGATTDAAKHLMVGLLEKMGHDPEIVKERLETFIGMKIADPKGGKRWLK
jgi:sulfhydrogenase subunit delta